MKVSSKAVDKVHESREGTTQDAAMNNNSRTCERYDALEFQPLQVPFTVVIDSRERAPYQFHGLHADADDNHRMLVIPTEWRYLKTGDYSIKGYESLVAVERKSLNDLYSTLGQHRERFENELQRLAMLEFAAVVVEASWDTIVNAPPEFSLLNPKCVFRTAVSWMVKYRVMWVAVEGRRAAEVTTFRLLEKWWKGYRERNINTS